VPDDVLPVDPPAECSSCGLNLAGAADAVGVPLSAGFVDRAAARLDENLTAAGFDEAMLAALLAEPALGADEPGRGAAGDRPTGYRRAADWHAQVHGHPDPG
jgi:hypothetical protein